LLAALILLGGLATIVATRDDGLVQTPETEATDKGRAPVVLIAVVVVAMLLQVVAGNSAMTFFNVYMDADLMASTARIGILAAIARLLSVPAPLLVPALAARWDRRRVVALAALGMAISVLVLSLIGHWVPAAIGFTGSTAFMLMWLCAVFPYIMTFTSQRWQSTMSGAGSLATGLSSSATALSGGFIAAALGFRVLFRMAAGITLLGVLLFWLYFRGPRGEPAPT
jgi:predicted MFS family arabinose efflux permease